jgi:hypothetical protein
MAKNELKKGASYFTLVGKVKLTKNTFKLDELSERTKYRYSRMNIGLDCGIETENVVYTELMGGYSEDPLKVNQLYVHGKKIDDNTSEVDDFDNRFEISFDDRHNESVISELGERCFMKVAIEKDIEGKLVTKKFLSSYDMIKYVSEHLQDGQEIKINGALKYSKYEGRVQCKKEIQSIYLYEYKENETPEYKAEGVQTILVSEDSIQKADTENSVIPFNVLVVDYDRDLKKNIPFEVNLEIPYNQADKEEFEKMLRMLMMLKPKKDITQAKVLINFQESAEMVEITDDMIDPDLMQLVKDGIVPMEAIKKKVVANTKTKSTKKIRLVRPELEYVELPDGDVTVKNSIIHEAYTEEDLIVATPEEDNTVGATDDDKADMLNAIGLG